MTEITPPVYTSDGSSFTMILGVTDSLVGSILGRQGVVVKEIMSLSGTQIQISQKDTYLPDSKHRSVKVVGLQHQVQVALSMIMAKVHCQPIHS
jgi:transcription antitermination factor NusA-like protein